MLQLQEKVENNVCVMLDRYNRSGEYANNNIVPCVSVACLDKLRLAWRWQGEQPGSAWPDLRLAAEGFEGSCETVTEHQRALLSESVLANFGRGGETAHSHFHLVPTAGSGRADLFWLCFGFLTSILMVSSRRVREGL